MPLATVTATLIPTSGPSYEEVRSKLSNKATASQVLSQTVQGWQGWIARKGSFDDGTQWLALYMTNPYTDTRTEPSIVAPFPHQKDSLQNPDAYAVMADKGPVNALTGDKVQLAGKIEEDSNYPGVPDLIDASIEVLPDSSKADNVTGPYGKDLVITLETGGCFGVCPVYKLTIQGDGKVIYEGIANVKVLGSANSTLDTVSLSRLVSTFEKVDFFSLDDEYPAEWSDLPSVIVSIMMNGRSKRVWDHYSSLHAPRKLFILENMIGEAVNSPQWVH